MLSQNDLRDIDEVLALKMGYTNINASHYTTVMAAAWEIAEKLHITISPSENGWKAANCNWSSSGDINAVGTTNGKKWIEADTASLAICLAAMQYFNCPVAQ